MPKEFFAPRISADTRPFWDGCREHKILMQRCKNCGKLRWPASYLCPDCLSEEKEYVEMSGKGTVYSYVIFKKAFDPSVADKLPYVTAEIDLEEGVRMISNIECSVDDERLDCGAKVTVEWQDFETYSKPVFTLEDE